MVRKGEKPRKPSDRVRVSRRNKGQAITEYAIFIAVIAGMIVILGRAIKNNFQNLMTATVRPRLQEQLTRSVHQYRFVIKR